MTGGPVEDATAMLAGMDPVLHSETYVFVVSDAEALLRGAFAVVREAEGTSLVIEVHVAKAWGLEVSEPMACITLTVHSSLTGIGLTAAVSGALAKSGIACNVVAGYHHDHLFVPMAKSDVALEILLAVQDAAQG